MSRMNNPSAAPFPRTTAISPHAGSLFSSLRLSIPPSLPPSGLPPLPIQLVSPTGEFAHSIPKEFRLAPLHSHPPTCPTSRTAHRRPVSPSLVASPPTYVTSALTVTLIRKRFIATTIHHYSHISGVLMPPPSTAPAIFQDPPTMRPFGYIAETSNVLDFCIVCAILRPSTQQLGADMRILLYIEGSNVVYPSDGPRHRSLGRRLLWVVTHHASP
ncbi:hypothetical protein M422DRAFT_265191 [Sphaerobolus stellatus SS14]|uniref:Uncharacterized protein n=1 Tax=Sphaerobolus stellatus (strain SS14) TaxID=990650 RepID=A0A0C9TS17_SPHS4|nr:hypothetical protein M422DRAFT_265191 [Sphaerobolus stellatus SS14]